MRRFGAERGIRPSRMITAGVAALSTLSILVSAAIVGGSGSGDGSRAGARVSVAPDATSAASIAREQGERVEVADLGTETRVVYAEPDGTMTAEVSMLPTRVRQNGVWVKPDTTLVRRQDGSIGPKAAAVDLAFSAGGESDPMVRYGDDRGWLALDWPHSLPQPELSKNVATYSEVLPGVDLVLHAELDGYSQFLVVKSVEAAVNPELAQLRLAVHTKGVTLKSAEGGALEARDAAGDLAFAAPESQMWDSSTPPRQAKVAVELRDGELVLSPDQGLLTDQRTKYPVTVDPRWHTADKYAWASVLSGNPDTNYWWSSGDPPWAQVGYCGFSGCNDIKVARSYFRFDTGFLAGKEVLEAYLNVVAVHSPDCDGVIHWHDVYKTSTNLESWNSTWNAAPGGSYVGGFIAPKVYGGCSDYQEASLNVTSAVNKGSFTTFYIRAADEGNSRAWRKYDNNAKLRVHFNGVPYVPTELTTDPPLRAPCKWCNGQRYIGDTSILFKARLSDPDGDQLYPLWHIWANHVKIVDEWGSPKGSGEIHSRPLGGLQHRQFVEWFVKAGDTAHESAFAGGTTFWVDRVAPDVAPTVSGVLYQNDNRWHGGVNVPGAFAFDSAGVNDGDVNGQPFNDVDHFLYGFSDPPTIKVDADKLGGKATVKLTPPGDGPRDLYVQSVDRAGHRSPTAKYHFYVRAGSGPLAQWPFEGNGVDEAFLGDRDAVPQGDVTYGSGAVGQAVALDGVDDHLTAPNALRTDASFSVSAWVYLDSAGYARAAVSQDGANFAGFDLWYRPANGGRWVFGMPRSNGAFAGTDMAWSAQPARTGQWTHLTGVYDTEANNDQLKLYVNGVLSGTADRTAVDWNATGRVRIGRTMWDGNPAVDHWDGRLDEVKLYDRALTPEQVRLAVGADDVETGYWQFDELEGSTAYNSVDGGEMAVLANGASFTGDGDGDQNPDGGSVGGAVRLDGVDDVVSTSGPVVHTDESFTVAAWVYLESAGSARAAVSQDGTNFAGFDLWYRPENGGRWVFGMPRSDEAFAGTDMAWSAGLAETGRWTHLTAVYDAQADDDQLKLYVDGVPSGTADRTATDWNAIGPIRIGRTMWDGNSAADHWHGLVDEIRAYNRELSAAEIKAMVARDGVALGKWNLDGNADDSSGNTRDGETHGSVQWTTGQTNVPDPTDLAARLNGTADYISAPHTVDVSKSFTVSAWVRLDGGSGLRTVLSQEGNRVSAFKLRATPDGRWSFVMFDQDVDGGGGRAEVFGGAAQPGVWTHLVAGYDAVDRRIYLYVNGVLAGTDDHVHGWNVEAGGLQIGRAKWNGSFIEYLPGAVDDVTIHGRVLFAEEIRTLAGRDLTLAHYWPLDEGSGASAADAVGRQTATLAGGATRVPGHLGNAIELDGVDGRVATDGIDIRTDASFTVSAWVYLTRTCTLGTQFACKQVAVSVDGSTNAVTTSKFRLGHRVDRNNLRGVWVFEMMPDPEDPSAQARAALPTVRSELNAWVHLVGVYDKPSGTLLLYVNGTRKGDATLTAPWNATGGLQIGRGRDATGAPGEYFPGWVDDVRIYSGALDNDRISNLYSSYPEEGEGGTPDLPVANAGHWTFDENTGTTAADSSGNGLTATLRSGAGWSPSRISTGVRFDGTANGFAATSGPALDTGHSFSVTAWAYQLSPGTDQVVLGQDGQQVSAFQVRYHAASNRWEALVAKADTADPDLIRLSSTEPVYLWTHLGLVYDEATTQLRLYVNGRLSATQVGVVPWGSSGPLTFGRGKWNGVSSGFFTGIVDDVRAFDRALSDGELRRVYNDAYPADHGSWQFDDETVRDWSWRNNPTSASGPISYVDGVIGKALALDGRSAESRAALTTQHLGVPPMSSLTVSAWAKLTYEPSVQTVLAQDGTRMSGFALQYRPELARWVFAATTADADSADVVYAASGKPAVLGRWTHLTGVYDHAAGQLRLYVDGHLAGTRNGVTVWLANRGFTIGRGLVHGEPAEFFTGAIDDVRADMGVVPDDEIARRAGYAPPAPGQMGRFVNGEGDHYTGSTTDPVRPGYHFEGPLGLPVPESQPNTRVLYACQSSSDGFSSTDPNCEGATTVGEIGRVFAQQPTNIPTVPIYRCTTGTDRFESRLSTCEGTTQESLLGYSLAYAWLSRYYSRTNDDHWGTTGGAPAGYRYEGQQGYVSLVPLQGTQPLISCWRPGDQFNSNDPACEGQEVLGGLGHVWTSPPPEADSVRIQRCTYASQRFTSRMSDCEQMQPDGELGYLLTALPDITAEFA